MYFNSDIPVLSNSATPRLPSPLPSHNCPGTSCDAEIGGAARELATNVLDPKSEAQKAGGGWSCRNLNGNHHGSAIRPQDYTEEKQAAQLPINNSNAHNPCNRSNVF